MAMISAMENKAYIITQHGEGSEVPGPVIETSVRIRSDYINLEENRPVTIMEAIRRFITTSPTMGIIYAVISTVAMTFAHFLAQTVEISSKNVSQLELVFVRCAVQLVILIPFILCLKTQVLYSSDNWMKLAILSISGYGGFIIIYFVLPLIPLSIALTLTATCPVFATIFSHLILKERCSWLDGLCGVASFLGVLLITRPMAIFGKYGVKEQVFFGKVSTSKYEAIYLSGCGLAVFLGITRALYLVVARQWKNHNPGSHQTIPLFYPTVLSCVMTPTLMIFKGDTLVLPGPLHARFAMFSLGILTTIGFMGLTLAVKTQNATVVGVIRNLEIIWAFVLQRLVTNIHVSPFSIGGSIIIILSTIIASFRKKIVENSDACCLSCTKKKDDSSDEEQAKLIE